MTVRPVVCGADSVRVILDGTQTQMRRLVLGAREVGGAWQYGSTAPWLVPMIMAADDDPANDNRPRRLAEVAVWPGGDS